MCINSTYRASQLVSFPTLFTRESCFLTNISWGATGCWHDPVVYHLWQAKVTNHNLGVFILAVVQNVLWLHRNKKDRWAFHAQMSLVMNFTCGGVTLVLKYLILWYFINPVIGTVPKKIPGKTKNIKVVHANYKWDLKWKEKFCLFLG